MLLPRQRHELLLAERTRDPVQITAAIEAALRKDPTVTLAAIDDVLRRAASSAFLVRTPDGFVVVVGFTAWREALAKAGISAEANRAALAMR